MQLGVLLEHFRTLEQSIYDILSNSFKPNIAKCPLPKPFQIVFAEEPPIGTLTKFKTPKVETYPFEETTLSKILLAMPDYGIPVEFLDTNKKSYKDDRIRSRVFEIIKDSVNSAAKASAQVITFPEYSLPKDRMNELQDLSSNTGLTIIGGVEGQLSEGVSPTLINKASIIFPHTKKILYQYKFRESNIESPFSQDYETPLLYFDRSPIGSFSVIVCSDYREFDILSSLITNDRRIHILFIISHNTQIELFQTFAIADSCRLQSYVAICNNFADQSDPLKASANGSVVCSPMTNPKKRILKPVESIELAPVDFCEYNPKISIHELNLSAVARDSSKPPAGFLPVPHCRKLPPTAIQAN